MLAFVLAVLVSRVAAAPQNSGVVGDSEPEDEPFSSGYEPLADEFPVDESPSYEPPEAPEVVPGRIIVKSNEGVTLEEKARIRSDEGLTKLEEPGSIGAEVGLVEGQSVEEAVRNLERRPEVRSTPIPTRLCTCTQQV